MFDPAEFNKLAGGLAARASAPAAYRTAMSRAYYAAYHVSCVFLREIGIDVKTNARGHMTAQQYLRSCNTRTDIAAIGSSLGDLHRDRITADYHLDKERKISQQKARDNVDIADKLICTLRAIPADEYAEICAAIRNEQNEIE